MFCPNCAAKTSVRETESMQIESELYVRRRRSCSGCRFRFNTKEIILPDSIIDFDLLNKQGKQEKQEKRSKKQTNKSEKNVDGLIFVHY